MRKNKISRIKRFARDIFLHTPFIKMIYGTVFLWILFSCGMYWAETTINDSSIKSFWDAMYWSIAAFSTAGIADTPQSPLGKLIGGIWSVLGSLLFFGAIVATVTTYFMRPIQRPARRIIDVIEYNLEQLNDLTLEELDLLKDTVDGLIVHVEKMKEKEIAKQKTAPEKK